MFSRRDFIRISGMASAAALMNWQCPSLARGGSAGEGKYDVVIIGAGLGGLACAGFLAKYGFKPLVIDQRDKPGGYATSFQRSVSRIDGEFICEASLHGVTGNPLSLALLGEEGLGVLDKLTRIPHKNSWSSLYPEPLYPGHQEPFLLDIPFYDTLPLEDQADAHFDIILGALLSMFPSEEIGIRGYMDCWHSLLGEIAAFYDPESKGMPADPADFPDFYPTWASMLDKMKINKVKTKKTKTLAELMDEYNLQDPGLRAVLGQSWIYYGLPPSQIPAWFYLMFTGLFHGYGSYYIQGTSQSLSDALVKTVMDGGGEVILGTEVDEIIIDNGKAVGVKANGEEYFAKAVVSNASVPQTFDRLMPASKEVDKLLKHYRARISEYQPGTSHFNVWLGLDLSNEDLSKSYEELGSSTLVYPSYNHDVPHDTLLGCDPEQSIVAVLAYDNLPSIDASPSGYGSVTLSMLSGYEPWKKFEAVYKAFHSSGDEDYVDEDGLTIEDYNIQKRNITEALIDLVKKQGLLPGLSDEMIVMKEASTPLTNVRYTLNPQGAIYGYEQTKDNSAFSRLGHKTPIEGLYLASAWAYPGGGFETVVLSGKGAFKSMIDDGIIS